MRYQNFIKRVQEVARLESREEAARASVATLETLGECISPREREELAAQLPSELKKHLCARHPNTLFPLEEFYDRVGARADLHYRDAVERALAVIAVLKEAVSPGEIEDILAELPEEYGELFGTRQPTSSSPPVSARR